MLCAVIEPRFQQTTDHECSTLWKSLAFNGPNALRIGRASKTTTRKVCSVISLSSSGECKCMTTILLQCYVAVCR